MVATKAAMIMFEGEDRWWTAEELADQFVIRGYSFRNKAQIGACIRANPGIEVRRPASRNDVLRYRLRDLDLYSKWMDFPNGSRMLEKLG